MENITDYIYALRKDYETKILYKADVKESPFEQFGIWMAEAVAEGIEDANAMVLATASKDGKPSSRVVLLRNFSEKGFVFYTNYLSQKGREIAENPYASLLFFWSKLERQVHIKGKISKASRKDAEEYFATRPRESQIGAWASAQSSVLANRLELEEKIAEAEKQFAGRDVPCPKYWGGYCLKPDSFEFWQGRPSRLHDRLLYTNTKFVWKIERLSP